MVVAAAAAAIVTVVTAVVTVMVAAAAAAIATAADVQRPMAAAVTMEPLAVSAKCSRPCVPSVAKPQPSRSSQLRVAQFIAAIVFKANAATAGNVPSVSFINTVLKGRC